MCSNTGPIKDKVCIEQPMAYSNNPGHLLIFIIFHPQGAGASSRDFTTNLVRQCRAFSGALEIGKLKAPLFRGPKGAVDSNEWCITLIKSYYFSHSSFMLYASSSEPVLCIIVVHIYRKISNKRSCSDKRPPPYLDSKNDNFLDISQQHTSL